MNRPSTARLGKEKTGSATITYLGTGTGTGTDSAVASTSGIAFSKGIGSGGLPPRVAAKGKSAQSTTMRGLPSTEASKKGGALSPSGAAAVLDLLSPGGSLGKGGGRGRDITEASSTLPLSVPPTIIKRATSDTVTAPEVAVGAAPRPCAPPSRPVPRLYEMPASAAARARKLAAGPPSSPRAALVQAVEAAAKGGAFTVPPGVTAVFVPADALPNARPDTPAGDLIAYLIPNQDVAAARALLGDSASARDSLGGGDADVGGGEEDARERSFILSSTSAELIHELDEFLSSATLHERWQALHEAYKKRTQ